jgi:membrane associated rhomboid family serine protease
MVLWAVPDYNSRSVLEILCLSIAAVGAYQAQLLLRHAGPGQRAYAFLLLADAVIGGAAVAATHLGATEAIADLIAALAIFGFVGLVFVPRLLRWMTGKALEQQWLRLALALTKLRELISPGLGARQERDLIEVVLAVRSGDFEGALTALRARRAAAQGKEERRALDDRIVFTLLSASRWDEAVELYERTREAGGPASLPLAVEMVRAYGELGDLERAAEIVGFLEDIAGGGADATLAYFVARARVLFLAYAGRADAVARILGGRGVVMPDAARAFLLGTARLYAGDADGARAELARAVALSAADPRGRALAAERLAAVGTAPPRVLSPEIAAFADHLAAAGPAPQSPALGNLRGSNVATWVLIALNLAVAGIVTWLLGPTDDAAVLARAGANLKVAVRAGEWWRLHASTFLHVGSLHLMVNMIGLWSLGRLVERLLGSLRFTVVYSLAGIAGAAASLLFGGPGISAGASGAVFGILGAAIAELAVVRREARSQPWRRMLLGNLVFIALLNLGIGAAVPFIDQSAHVGGLVTGGLLTLALSPGGRAGRTRLASLAAATLFALCCASAALTVAAVAATPYASTLARVGWARQELGAMSLELPRIWERLEGGDAADEPTWPLTTNLVVHVIDRKDVPGVQEAVKDGIAQESEVHDVREAAPPPVPLPAEWIAHAFTFNFSGDGESGRFHILIYARVVGDKAMVVQMFVPEARLGDAAELVPRILGSAALRP